MDSHSSSLSQRGVGVNSILLISGHPDLKSSYANKTILDAMRADANISIRRLDALYPDFQIDVKAEQGSLLDADLVILQFPLYWSSYPAIMKQWLDAVFTYNFAFGPEGDKLLDKKLILSITCGAEANSYAEGGFNFFSIEQYLQAALHPIKAAKMQIVDTIITYEMNAIEAEGGDKQRVYSLAQSHAMRLRTSISQHILR